MKNFSLLLLIIQVLAFLNRSFSLIKRLTGKLVSTKAGALTINLSAQKTPFAIGMTFFILLALLALGVLYWHNYRLAKEEELPEKFVFEANAVYLLLVTLFDVVIARRMMPSLPLMVTIGTSGVSFGLYLAMIAYPYWLLRQLKRSHREMDEEERIFNQGMFKKIRLKVGRKG